MELKPGYKQTEIGVIPEDWIVKPLGELGQFKNGINKGKEDFGHGFPFINLMDVFGIPKVSTLTTEFGLVNTTTAEQDLYELKGGDVLFVRSSVKPEGVGLTALIPKDLPHTVFSGFLIRFRDSGLLELGFKEHCFWDKEFRARLISNSTVSANANINQDALKRLQIAFPPTETEQRSIATALSDMDELLGGLDRLITKKHDLKQSAMQQLLTGKIRLPEFDKEKGYKQTELGVIPENWKVLPFEKLAHIERGKFTARPRNDPQYYGGDIPFIQTGDVTNSSGQITTYSQTLNAKGLKVSKLFPSGTLFFTIAANIGDVGFTAFDAACPDSLVAIMPNQGIDKTWLAYELAKRKASFESIATHNTQLNINLEKLRPYLLPLPPLPEQTAIASILSDMDTEIATLEQRRNKTRDLKQAMMQELLTGRIRLV